MRISVNGTEREVPNGVVLADLLPGSAEGTAVAVDGEVVPRSELAGRRLVEGDVVEVVTAVQGG